MNGRLSVFFLVLVICFYGQIKSVTREQLNTEIRNNGLDDSFFRAPVFYRLLGFQLSEIDEGLLSKIVKFSAKIHRCFSEMRFCGDGQYKLASFLYNLPLVDRSFIVCLLDDSYDEDIENYGDYICRILIAAAEKLRSDEDCLYKVGSHSENLILNPEYANKFLSESFSTLLDCFFECVKANQKLVELKEIVRLRLYKHSTTSRKNISFIGWLLRQTSEAIKRVEERRRVVS